MSILRDETWKVIPLEMKINTKEGSGKEGKGRCIDGLRLRFQLYVSALCVLMRLLEFKSWKSSRL